MIQLLIKLRQPLPSSTGAVEQHIHGIADSLSFVAALRGQQHPYIPFIFSCTLLEYVAVRNDTLLPPAIVQLSAVTFARLNSSISWSPSSHLCYSSLFL